MVALGPLRGSSEPRLPVPSRSLCLFALPMARLTHPDCQPVFSAAEAWKQKCLIGRRSLFFSGQPREARLDPRGRPPALRREPSRRLNQFRNPGSHAGFYRTARSAVEQAVQGASTARARRRAERGAIYATLEQSGYIKRTRGGVPLEGVKGDRLS